MLRQFAKCAISLLTWAAMALAQSAPITVTYSYAGFPVYIARDSANIVSFATLTVPDALKMTKVTVKVQIEYPEVGDLNLFLYSPDGTRVKLLERNCGSLQNVDTTFDDAAPVKYADYCPAQPGQGPFRGNEPLTNYNDADSSLGRWRLAVENNGSDSRTGWLKGFTLQITGNSQLFPVFRADTVLNNAGARTGVIVPGETITILGFGLGPFEGVTAPAGTLPTTLGGVQVSINGADIPLFYASRYRVDAQVPFNLSTTGPASVRVQNSGSSSTAVQVNTQLTFPGIYTFDQLGVGPAKAYNQDGKLNSSLAPARAGDSISVFGSGLGAVVPATPAGQGAPANPLSIVSQPVAASIGGVPAAVTFAGLAPGYAGLYQVNITVPAGLPAGTREVVISNGGNASQSGATIEVQ
jgi:uncharacterized protein (TIGR03437 family)